MSDDLTCFPSLMAPIPCEADPRLVEPDPSPTAVSPVPLCVSPSLGPIACTDTDLCADAFFCTVTTVAEVGAVAAPPALPVTGGGSDLALACLLLGFVLTFAGILLRRLAR